MFTLKIKTRGAAFDNPREEISRIMADVQVALTHGRTQGVAIDINGNTVGEWRLTK